MKIRLFTLLAVIFGTVFSNAQDVALPIIPDREISITDFEGDFNKAMKYLASKGGGRLNVPAGLWNTGPIQFENNCELHVEQGALVLFSSDYDAYEFVETIYEGIKTKKKMSPLTAIGKHDIAITGKGCFDAQGQVWRPVKKSKLSNGEWKNLLKKGGTVENDIWYPEIKERYMNRPVLLNFVRCQRVLLKEATFSNSPAWNLHPFLCEDVTIDGVNVRNPWYAQNGDGLDLECCNRVVVRNSTFDVGDDAICIKAGKNKEGRDLKAPCQNVLIEGCTVYHGHGGFTIGSEMSSGVNNVTVKNCLFMGTDTGLRFKSTRGRGGVVKNIKIDGIRMYGITGDAVTFDLFYFNSAAEAEKEYSVSEETPEFRDIEIENVYCLGAKRAIYMNGLPEMPISNVKIKNSTFYAEQEFEIHNTKNFQREGVVFEKQ